MRERGKKVLGKGKSTKKLKKALIITVITVIFVLIVVYVIGLDYELYIEPKKNLTLSQVLEENIKQLPPLPAILNEREAFKEIKDTYNDTLELQQNNVLGGLGESDVDKINQIIGELESIPKETLDEIEHFKRLIQERVQLKDKISVYELSEKRINEKIDEREKNIKEEYLKEETTDDQKKWFKNEDGTWELDKDKAHQMGEERAMREYPTRYTTRAFRQIDLDYGTAWKNYYSSQREYDKIVDYVATIPTLAKNEVETGVENETKMVKEKLDIINKEWEDSVIKGMLDTEKNLNDKIRGYEQTIKGIYKKYRTIIGKNIIDWSSRNIEQFRIDYFNKVVKEIPDDLLFTYPEYYESIQAIYTNIEDDIERDVFDDDWNILHYAERINVVIRHLNEQISKSKRPQIERMINDHPKLYANIIVLGIILPIVLFIDRCVVKQRIRAEIRQLEWEEEYINKVLKEREQKREQNKLKRARTKT